MNMDWWQLSLMVLGFVMLIRLLLSPYLVYKRITNELREMRDHSKASNELELMEVRRKVRDYQGDVKEIADIPKILWVMLQAVKGIYELKKGKKQDDKKLWEVYLEFMDIEANDPYLVPEHFNSPIAIRKSMKYFYKKIGFDKKRKNPSLEKRFRRRITNIMDGKKIGLRLKQDENFQKIYNQLAEKRMPIAGSLVDAQIDNFVEDLASLYSFRLMIAYGKVEKNLYLFPNEMRDALRDFAENVERIMRLNYGKVKQTLEMFAIGGDVSV
jgi:hypothetical protein